MDAIELKVPDRVPVSVTFQFFPARFCGYTMQDMMYNPKKLSDAQLKTIFVF
jgi:hypothetical protein